MALQRAVAAPPRIVMAMTIPVSGLLTDHLTGHSRGAEAVASGAALRERSSDRLFDLMILDIMTPAEDVRSTLLFVPTLDAARALLLLN